MEDKTIYLVGLWAKMSQTSLPTCCLLSNDRRQQIGCRVRQNACCSHTHSPDVKRDRNKVMEKHEDHGTVNEILYTFFKINDCICLTRIVSLALFYMSALYKLTTESCLKPLGYIYNACLVRAFSVDLKPKKKVIINSFIH